MLTQAEAFELLLANGYIEPRVLPDGRYTAVMQLAYTAAIIICGASTVEQGIDERWCFHSAAEALAASAKWDGTGDPEGWHRHIPSGRRRKDADPLQEYILH